MKRLSVRNYLGIKLFAFMVAIFVLFMPFRVFAADGDPSASGDTEVTTEATTEETPTETPAADAARESFLHDGVQNCESETCRELR